MLPPGAMRMAAGLAKRSGVVRKLTSQVGKSGVARKLGGMAKKTFGHISKNKIKYTIGGALASNSIAGAVLNRRYAKKYGASKGQRRLATASGALGGVGSHLKMRIGGFLGRNKSSKTRAVGSVALGGISGGIGYSIRSKSRVRRAQ